jgi:molybdenum cofactor guanylyltransferase
VSFGGINKASLDVSSIILAGGKSKRLGRNKIIEIFDDQSLLERVISRLQFSESEIIIVTGKDSVLPRINNSQVRLIEDMYPGKGSLGGIYTGLIRSKTFLNIVVACDMPFINQGLLSYMINVIDNFDVAIPRIGNYVEPLHAIYSKNCLPAIKALIKENRLPILELFPLIKTRYVEKAEIGDFDPHHLSFFNINTEADLDKGKELVRKKDIQVDKC